MDRREAIFRGLMLAAGAAAGNVARAELQPGHAESPAQHSNGNSRKLVVSVLMALDGVTQDPAGTENTEFGGWVRGHWNEENSKFKSDELIDSDGLLLGRATYDIFAATWPSGKGAFADRMNALPKYVVSTTLKEASWSNSKVIHGDVVATVSALKQQPGKNILVVGSGTLVQTLMQHDLVDEYRLLVFPVVVGGGKRLFAEKGHASLTLAEAKGFGSGAVALVYKATRKEA